MTQQDAPTEGMRVGDFVDAYNAHGELQSVPAHWLDHPVLGLDFTVEPPTATDVPSLKWTRDQLLEHATAKNVDLSGYGGDEATKPQILAAINGEPNPA